jgi:aspartyl-tRNA synthetase
MGDEPLRTDAAGALRTADVGRSVRVAGWVNTRRDHGGVVFVDLRDASGIVQVVVRPDEAPGLDDLAHRLRDEYCIAVTGTVRERDPDNVNPEMATGGGEVVASDMKLLSAAAALPFQIDDRAEVDEVRRLAYRYLDLRRPRMATNLRARSRAVTAMRRSMESQGFLEIETPTLIKSTPEGARDFLVPSRLRQGSFYALPQSPQLFKQLLMVAGVERYYQIARCYRDEDFRADRQVEFTQLDLEGAFWGQDDVFEALEGVMAEVVRELKGVEIPTPFPRLTYAEAMASYGTDKPDVRFGMAFADLGEVLAETGFQAFAGVLADGGVVRGFNAGDQGLSRAAKGLVWAVAEDDGSLRSPVAKFLSDAEIAGIRSTLDAAPGDLLVIVADRARVAGGVLDDLRRHLGQPGGHDELRFLWVTDFPVFEKMPDGRLAPAHHPFTAPVDITEMEESPETAISKAYDLVLNGAELGSGSVRIHDSDTQRRVFTVLGISDEEAEQRFGWFLRALRYGTPPHAGFAVGIDRLVSILQDEPNIREVIPFPKTQTGTDPLTESPTPVGDDQLRELGLDLRPEVRAALEEDRGSRE